MNSSFYCVGFVAMVAVLCVQADDFAKLAEKSPAGFQIQITRKLDCDSKEAYKRFVDDFSKWYDASHSTPVILIHKRRRIFRLTCSGIACLEVLPDGGFVRHMDVVFHQPGKTLRMTGGLGPLQGMGVSGGNVFVYQ